MPLKYVRFVHSQSLSVKRLSGFDKRHSIPDRVSSATEAFVAKLAVKEIEEEAGRVFQELKRAYRLKRQEITYTTGEGIGSIVTPYFDFSISVSANPDDASEAVIRREVTNIRDPQIVVSDDFDQIFQGMFDRLEFGGQEPIDIEDVVDQIEARDDEKVSIEYDPDLTHCSIQIVGISADIEVTAESFCVVQKGRKSPKALLVSFFGAQHVLVETLQLNNLRFQLLQ